MRAVSRCLYPAWMPVIIHFQPSSRSSVVVPDQQPRAGKYAEVNASGRGGAGANLTDGRDNDAVSERAGDLCGRHV